MRKDAGKIIIISTSFLFVKRKPLINRITLRFSSKRLRTIRNTRKCQLAGVVRVYSSPEVFGLTRISINLGPGKHIYNVPVRARSALKANRVTLNGSVTCKKHISTMTRLSYIFQGTILRLSNQPIVRRKELIR